MMPEQIIVNALLTAIVLTGIIAAVMAAAIWELGTDTRRQRQQAARAAWTPADYDFFRYLCAESPLAVVPKREDP